MPPHIKVEELIKKIREFRDSIPHKLNFYFNQPSKRFIVTCDKCGYDVKDCPMVKGLKNDKR